MAALRAGKRPRRRKYLLDLPVAGRAVHETLQHLPASQVGCATSGGCQLPDHTPGAASFLAPPLRPHSCLDGRLPPASAMFQPPLEKFGEVLSPCPDTPTTSLNHKAQLTSMRCSPHPCGADHTPGGCQLPDHTPGPFGPSGPGGGLEVNCQFSCWCPLGFPACRPFTSSWVGALLAQVEVAHELWLPS